MISKAGHGDVRIFRISELPEGLVPFETSALAEGELTGHAHRMEQRPGTQVLVDPKTKVRYLKVVEPSALTHEEHHTRVVPPGIYRIGIVREADHIEGVVRRVAD